MKYWIVVPVFHGNHRLTENSPGAGPDFFERLDGVIGITANLFQE